MNQDFQDLLRALNDAKARFLIVGAYALAVHGTPRATGDIVGLPPRRIDILTEISGIDFDKAWPNRVEAAFGEVRVPVLGPRDFIENKRQTGRPKDLIDAQQLSKLLEDSDSS